MAYLEEECPGRVNIKCKGPETGMCLRNNKEATVAGEEQARKRMTDFVYLTKSDLVLTIYQTLF